MATQSISPTNTRRFLITGAKGFIGAWIVKNLVARGDRPWIFDLDRESHRLRALLSEEQMGAISFVLGDVTHFEELDRAVAEHGITHLIHLAAVQVPACAANPRLGAQINVLGTLNVFEVARRRPDLVKRIVYASSAAVFGPEEFYEASTVPEGAVLEPGTHYGVFKQCNEGNARVYYKIDGISSVGLRPWAVYGVGRDVGVTSGPTKAIKAAVLGRDYAIRFTGGLDLQYVDDAAKLFLRCAESELPGARIYTLRGTVIQMQDFIAALHEDSPQTQSHISAVGPTLPIAYDLDDSALIRDFGDIPKTPLAQGIRETREIFERLRNAGKLTTDDLDT
ncbi:MAG TPA: NAD(P)-dependent oxidoreductase [Terriglobia bacterium]|nr:NAD(P)-dependent oxidoreductase [Terriglobia bacterium]